MGKEADLIFNVPVRTPFWGLGEHEALIIVCFFLFSLPGIGRDLGQSKRFLGYL